MLRPKTKRIKKNNDTLYSYFCGILAGIAFILFFNLTYFKFTFKNLPSNSIFIAKSLRYNNPTSLNIPILMYHYVEVVQDSRDTIRKSLSILPWTFEEQIKTLKTDGYTFITPKDLNNILTDRSPMPKKPIILSFDDGYGDFYTDVFPILQKYKVHAVAYIISGFLNQPNYLTRSELKEIIRSKIVEIGCHTMHHPALAKTSVPEAISEISGCHNDLLKEFGINTVSFAYPYGSYDPFLFPLVAGAGFNNAVTTEPGTNISHSNIYNIPRLRPGNRMGVELSSYLKSSVLADKKTLPFIKSANASEKTGEYQPNSRL